MDEVRIDHYDEKGPYIEFSAGDKRTLVHLTWNGAMNLVGEINRIIHQKAEKPNKFW